MGSKFERNYLRLVDETIANGRTAMSRAGPTRSFFGGAFLIYETAEGKLPILTTRKIYYKPILGELTAFLRGATDLETFKNFGCNYLGPNAGNWRPNKDKAPKDWSVGRVYGAQWRTWDNREGDPVDQLKLLVDGLKKDP